MSNYCFMHMRQVPDGSGWGPDFPDDFGFGLLFDPRGVEARWGVYEYTPTDDSEWTPPPGVSRELESLIDSAKRYPPALALSRDDMTHQFRDRTPTQDEFADALAAALSARLAQQATAGFILARATGNELGYLDRGDWHWVLGTAPTEPLTVWWVSDDYFVYKNPASDFQITTEQLASLRSHPAAQR